ncbi:MAG: hypothetical protein HY695_10630 [Deltaproteobacteria bacterium]|nr:hypothetical protein [Deltaproteobacteria bacterium]
MKLPGSGQSPTGRKRIKILVSFVYCLVALPLVFTCGKKGDPRAPELAIPEAIRDLKAQPERKGISLTWSRPRRYVDGKELRDLAGFVIFRKEISRSCPDCPVPYRERITVNVEDHEKFIKKRQYRFIDEEIQSQRSYRYRVFSQLLDGSLSDPSNEVEVAWRP